MRKMRMTWIDGREFKRRTKLRLDELLMVFILQKWNVTINSNIDKISMFHESPRLIFI